MHAKIINELIETRINGNSIKNNKTYMSMINRITINDILTYANSYGYAVQGVTKINLIESIVKSITKG